MSHDAYQKMIVRYRLGQMLSEGDFPVTEEAGRAVVALPFFSKLTEEQVDYVVRTLKEAIVRNRR